MIIIESLEALHCSRLQFKGGARLVKVFFFIVFLGQVIN